MGKRPEPVENTPHTRERERELVRAAAAGDPLAFEELLSPYMQRAYGYALRHTGDPTLAEDVCQEAFLKAFRGIGGFAGNSAFSTWLFRIIYTSFMDHVRRPRLVAMEQPEGADEPLETQALALDRFLEDLRQQERDEWLMAGIFQLPPDLRTVVVLRDMQGFSYEEISAITGELEGTVKSRLSRGRERLRRILTGDLQTASR